MRDIVLTKSIESMNDDITAARLAVVAAKAKILADKYKHGQLWAGDLHRMLSEIESEINKVRSESGC